MQYVLFNYNYKVPCGVVYIWYNVILKVPGCIFSEFYICLSTNFKNDHSGLIALYIFNLKISTVTGFSNRRVKPCTYLALSGGDV